MSARPQASARWNSSGDPDRGDARRIPESRDARRLRVQAAGAPAATHIQETVRGPCGNSERYRAMNSLRSEDIRDISQSLLSFALTVPVEKHRYSIYGRNSVGNVISSRLFCYR